MPLWLILSAVGIGGYLLLSKSASASTSNVAAAQAQANAAMAQSIAQNPSGLAPGFQGQATGPYTPAAPPPYDPGLGSVQQGGQVFDPNLGGTPDINSILSGMQPGYQGETTAAGTVGRRR